MMEATAYTCGAYIHCTFACEHENLLITSNRTLLNTLKYLFFILQYFLLMVIAE